MVFPFRFALPYSLLVVSCLTTLAVGPSSSWAAGEGKSSTPHLTVVELFTSQGCSACPAADRLIAELAEMPGVLPLSWAIDYWDYLGWRDTFGKPEHTERQRHYNRRLGLTGVYTPQVIIQGSVETIGSRRDAIVSLVATEQNGTLVTPDKAASDKAAPQNSPKISLRLSLKGDRLNVALGKAKLPEKAEVWLVAYARERTVLVERGENKGQMLSYHNLVLASGKLGDWTGKKTSFSAALPPLQATDADGVAILVQYEDSGRIIAASYQPLRPQALETHVDAPLHITRR